MNPEVVNYMIYYLRLTNNYSLISNRVKDKDKVLEKEIMGDINLFTCDKSEDELYRWFMDTYNKTTKDTNIAEYMEYVDINDENQLRYIIKREYLYQKLKDDTKNLNRL